MKHQTLKHILAAIIFVVGASLTAAAQAENTNYTVTNTNDSGAGGLRQAIADANANADANTIVFASPLFDTAQTINLTSAGLQISNPLTVTGTGARLLTVRRNTATNFPVFQIGAGTVRISGMTVSNGSNVGGGGSDFNTSSGSSILALDGVAAIGNAGAESAVGALNGTITITNSLISNNSVIGVIAEGTINIANSTISGNNGTSVGAAGGVLTLGTVNLNNVTVANNINGGIENSGTFNIRNTIVTGSTVRADTVGAFVSQGNNLISNRGTATGFNTASGDKLNVAANLAALANNGGNTDTHVLNTGSPAINAGNNCVVMAACSPNNPPVALTNDQRGAGFSRQSGAAVDIGAFEVQAPPTAASVSITGRVLTANGRGIRNVRVKIYGGSLSEPRAARTSAFDYYRLNDLQPGETYILEVRGKRYSFTNPIRAISPTGDAVGQNFVAEQ